MITVEQAEKLIRAEAKNFGTEHVSFDESVGRILAQDILADRDLPPFNRVTMDGVAVSYRAIESGVTQFKIKATQAAGDNPIETAVSSDCIEIMTGAALSDSLDTVIPYEQVEIENGRATLRVTDVKQGQNIHRKGADKKRGEVIIPSGRLISPALVNTLASVGKTELQVKKLPRVVIVSSGDELVDIDRDPSPTQIRKSNSYTIQAVLNKHQIHADLLHISDNAGITKEKISHCLVNYDVILMTGGISMGKFDYIPRALDETGVKTIFHKVSQRPGKPFWFGKHPNGVLVFAFPGNPVATFMCLHRYFLPWLNAILGLEEKPVYGVLNQDFAFKPELQYFLQVQLHFGKDGRLLADPVEGNGSGDFANLADTDAFIELPMEQSDFKKGEAFKLWMF